MDDEEIIKLLWERKEQGLSELASKYGALCMKTAYNILSNREDSEECVWDAYMGVWNAVPPQKPDPLRAFLLRIVRNLSVKRYRYNNASRRKNTYDVCIDEWEDCLGTGDSVQEEYEKKLVAVYIDEFLDRADVTDRQTYFRQAVLVYGFL